MKNKSRRHLQLKHDGAEKCTTTTTLLLSPKVIITVRTERGYEVQGLFSSLTGESSLCSMLCVCCVLCSLYVRTLDGVYKPKPLTIFYLNDNSL